MHVTDWLHILIDNMSYSSCCQEHHLFHFHVVNTQPTPDWLTTVYQAYQPWMDSHHWIRQSKCLAFTTWLQGYMTQAFLFGSCVSLNVGEPETLSSLRPGFLLGWLSGLFALLSLLCFGWLLIIFSWRISIWAVPHGSFRGLWWLFTLRTENLHRICIYFSPNQGRVCFWFL